MPEIKYTVENLIGGVKVATWANVKAGDTCTPFVCPQFADKSVHPTGVFNGATITIRGSNHTDPASAVYDTLNDPQGTALIFSGSARFEQILENSYLVKPEISGGDGSTNVTIKLLVVTPTLYDLFIPNAP